jgi:hypothetical protein
MLHLPIFNCNGDWRVIHIKKLNLLSNMASYIKLKRHEKKGKKKEKKSKGILYREMSLLIFILIVIGKDGDVVHSYYYWQIKMYFLIFISCNFIML